MLDKILNQSFSETITINTVNKGGVHDRKR